MANDILNLEKKFLAYLFTDSRYIALSIGKVKKESLPNTYMIYNLLIGYYNKYKGVVTDTIVDAMFKKKNISTDLIVKYKSMINQIKAIPISDEAEFEALLEQLDNQKKREEYFNIANRIIDVNPAECSDNELRDLEDLVKTTIINLTAEKSETRAEGTIKNSVKDRKERYRKIKENPDSIITYKSGFKKIDDAEGGFRPGELVYIIGRKGDGKSVLMINLAHAFWAQGLNVILFSLEISKEDYERRFDARAAEVPSNGLKRGTLTDVEEKIYNEYLNGLEQGLTPDGKKAGNLYIVDAPSGVTPAYIESKMEILEKTLGIKFDVAISDYAGIMLPNTHIETKRLEQSNIALDLKRIARRRNCLVISAAQMNRKKGEKDDEEIDTERVAESDGISDHIDWGIAIRSTGPMHGRIQSFKTRDAAPFSFKFEKQYHIMKIQELKDELAAWDGLTV